MVLRFYFVWLSMHSGSRVHGFLHHMIKAAGNIDDNTKFQDLPITSEMTVL